MLVASVPANALAAVNAVFAVKSSLLNMGGLPARCNLPIAGKAGNRIFFSERSIH